MRSMGCRAEKDRVFWAVLTGTVEAPILDSNDKVVIPREYSESQGLNFVRNQLMTLIRKFEVQQLGVRLSETFLKTKPSSTALASMFQRARIEGVVMEIAQELGCTVTPGNLQKIGQGLGTRSAKAYLDRDELRGLDISSIKNASMREAILTAASLLEK